MAKNMTVEELIRELKNYNPKAKVITYDSDWGPVFINAAEEEEDKIVLDWDMVER